MSKVTVNIQYCGAWGYGKYAKALSSSIASYFGDGVVDVTFEKDSGATGNFEVTMNGTLIHSKTKDGKGRCESDKEKAVVMEQIEAYLESL